MYYRFFKPVVIGILLGLAAFIMPLFILKVITFFLIAGLLIRFIVFRKIRRFFKNQLFYNHFADTMGKTEYYSYKQNGKDFSDFYGKPKGQTIEIEVK